MLASEYKAYSTLLLQVAITTYILISLIICLGSVYKEKFGSYSTYALVSATIFTTFIGGILNYVNPVSKWYTFVGASQILQSELWKFRARVGDYSMQKPSIIAKKLHKILIKTTRDTISKAGITESTVNRDYNVKDIKFWQYKSNDKEEYRINQKQGEISNLESDFPPMSTLSFRNNKSKNELSDQESKCIDNHYSPITPIEYINFRMNSSIDYYQKKLPGCNKGIRLQQISTLILGAVSTILAFVKLDIWITLVNLILSQIAQYKDFYGYDKKIERYNYLIDQMNDNLIWWMSLSKNEKNNQVNIEKLIINTEFYIVEENKKWLGGSVNTIKLKFGNEKENENEKEKEKGGKNGSDVHSHE